MSAANARQALAALGKETLVRPGRDREAAEARDYLRAFIAASEHALAAVSAELEAQDADILRHAQHYDHACRQCIPDGPLWSSMASGFACAYHRALARKAAKR